MYISMPNLLHTKTKALLQEMKGASELKQR